MVRIATASEACDSVRYAVYTIQGEAATWRLGLKCIPSFIWISKLSLVFYTVYFSVQVISSLGLIVCPVSLPSFPNCLFDYLHYLYV